MQKKGYRIGSPLFLIKLVAWDRIELPTRGFSVRVAAVISASKNRLFSRFKNSHWSSYWSLRHFFLVFLCRSSLICRFR